ncbi:type II toxin-antitoxin system HicA family toxin [Nostoc sp.]|uniref:type II toxin-antitoxin system HicA family toxin n=1 Tax=Nostoc sp. TaxID=1180 RepID=UPI002FFCEED3
MHGSWYLDRTKGSHRQFKHQGKPGLVTVPGKLSDDLALVLSVVFGGKHSYKENGNALRSGD